ncbi:MAG TPA: BTAD domain-containing putative transcriptional regulator, partial [Anaerolineales bacterium]
MRLSLEFLGPPQLQLDEKPVTASRRAVVALLAYLAVNDLSHPYQRYTREALSALLWTDYDPSKALANLRHTLWEVNRLIGDGWIVGEHETLYLNPHANLTLDVKQFLSLTQQAARQPEPALRIPLLLEASKLYRADFLAGFGLREAINFNEWVSVEAQNLRRDFVSVLDMLVKDYSAIGQSESAIPHAQRLLALDPLDEAAHSRLMELYVQIDQPSAALHQYQTLEKILRRELNLNPQPETHALYKKIRKGEFKPFSIEKKLGQVKKIVPKHNLPSHLTTFVGRGKEREAVTGLLA